MTWESADNLTGLSHHDLSTPPAVTTHCHHRLGGHDLLASDAATEALASRLGMPISSGFSGLEFDEAALRLVLGSEAGWCGRSLSRNRPAGNES